MRFRVSSIITALVLFVSSGALVSAQTPPVAPAYPWEGEVSATNVYVRSGAGSNWYPTTKLSKGQRVLVLGEKFGWYQITPPEGSFSFVDMAMVDRAPGAKKGTIKQDKTYVRAGSQLESRKNSTQLVLNKGDTVDIIGDADGFLKITPPTGASLYISKQYVKPVDARLRTGMVERHVSGKPAVEPKPIAAAPQQSSPAPVNTSPATIAQTPPSSPPPTENAIKIPQAKPITPTNTTPSSTTPTPTNTNTTPSLAAAPANPDSTKTSPAATPLEKPSHANANRPISAAPAAPAEQPESTRYKTMLNVLEGELVSMIARPIDQQNFDDLRKRYQEVATQSDEYVPSEIAKIRVRQLNDRAQLRLARSEILSDSESIAAYRANMDQERMKILRRKIDAAMVKYDLEGELWRSYAFAPESKRYRLVDPANKNTIAYVDIPVETDPNPDHLIGQLVGITTSGQKFSPAARVPIAVARSITDLSPRNPLPGQMRGGEPGSNESRGAEPMTERMRDPFAEPKLDSTIEPRQDIDLPARSVEPQMHPQAEPPAEQPLQQPADPSHVPANSDETPDAQPSTQT